MTPVDINPADILKYLAAGAVALIVWFLRREIEKVGADLASKADKEHMQREIGDLKMELKESREARERDMERIERTNAEKFAEFSASVKDRLGAMERNMENSISSMRDDVKGKLDMILTVMSDIRKE